MKKQKIMKVTVIVGIIAVILLGVTFALTSITTAGTKRQVITTGELDIILDEDDAINLTNAMPVYDEVGMIGDAFNFRLVNKTPVSLAYTLKLVKVSTSNELSPEIVRYGLTKDGETTIDFLSTITDDIVDSGTISGNQTIEYSLRLWIDINVEDETLISGKTLSYRVDAEASEDTSASEEQPIGEVKELAFSEENLGENCSTYNDGTDTFLVGQCSQNYVWYSGKLWRVVLKNNETGAVKMVTDDALTTIIFTDPNLSKIAFKNSYVDQWLNQEFLPTLHDYEDYLVVDSQWDATTSTTSSQRPNNTTMVSRTVGLLNNYEYYTTYNGISGLATAETGYLNNGLYWWLLNPYNLTKNLDVTSTGQINYIDIVNFLGVRPAVYLKNQINILSGGGTKDNPYRLVGDIQKATNGTTLLSTRYSGEYITFNNELYRIVDVENNLTKITAVNVLPSFENQRFGSISYSFKNSNIHTTLNTYYTNLNSNVKEMIEPNTTWYLGNASLNNYKSTICAEYDDNVSARTCTRTTSTVETSIALLRNGEIFSSHLTRDEKLPFWLLSMYSDMSSLYISADGRARYTSNTGDLFGVRPSMYLKSNVVISKDNTGDGTYEHPYDIELGA